MQATTPTTRSSSIFPAMAVNRILGGWYIRSLLAKGSLIEDAENLKDAWEQYLKGTRLILICNHMSYADSHVVEQMLGSNGLGEIASKLYHVAGQKTYVTIWRRFFTRGVNTIKVFQAGVEAPLSDKRRQSIESFRAFKKVVTTNPVLLFPEGTRTRTGRMGPGVPVLVNYLRGSLVLPIALQGTEKMLGVGASIPKRIKVVLRIGKAFIAQASRPIDKEREMAGYVERVVDLLDPAYRPLEATE